MIENKKKLIANGIYYITYNIVNFIFPLISGIYIARVIHPETIGRLFAAQNLAQYFVVFSFLGIPTYGIREIAKIKTNIEERSKIFTELITINTFSTFFFLLTYLILIIEVKTYRSDIILYLIAGISILLNIFNISWLYDGLEEFRFTSLRNALIKAISLLLLFILIKDSKDYILYAFICVFGVAGNNIINVIYAHRFTQLSFRSLAIKKHLKPIIILLGVNIAIELYSLMDITMMNYFSKKETITYYKYGHSIYLILIQVINSITVIIVPRLTQYFQDKKLDQFNQLLSETIKILFIIAAPMIIGIYFTSDFLLTSIYGESFLTSSKVLKLFSILLVVSPIGYLLGSRVLLVTNRERLTLIAVIISAAINFCGNIILIPRYHEIGATIASIISETVLMVCFLLLMPRFIRLTHIISSMIKVIIALGPMALFLYGCSKLSMNQWGILALQVLGSLIVYLACLIFIKEKTVYQLTMKYLHKRI